eukprot:TRINITY_DN8213_c0_g1_i1.p1 TRINITY_DN8213_c0_g1~~TRINITY_DN8213_c0_g1_i1.p1  ORF type:complete len:513 (-),score=66.54 TRINITY_DN8213_c0_g1_i1:8-1546(-)
MQPSKRARNEQASGREKELLARLRDLEDKEWRIRTQVEELRLREKELLKIADEIERSAVVPKRRRSPSPRANPNSDKPLPVPTPIPKSKERTGEDKEVEKQMEQYQRANDLPKCIALFDRMKSRKVELTPRTYHMMLSVASLHNDLDFLHRVVIEALKLPLTVHYYQDMIFTLSQSLAPEEALQLYSNMKRRKILVQDPTTWRQLAACCKNPADAFGIFQDMKQAGVHIPPPVYKTLIVALLPNAIQTQEVLQEMDRSGIKPSSLLQMTDQSETPRVLEAMRQCGCKIDSAAFNKLALEGPSVALLAFQMYAAAGGVPSPSQCSLILGHATDHPEIALTLWKVIKTQRSNPEELCLSILQILSASLDEHIFDIYKEMKSYIAPRLEYFRLLLRVAKKYRNVGFVKDIWREMHSSNTAPDSEAISLLLHSCVENIGVLTELYDVIKASHLTFPPDTEGILSEAFSKSSATRDRLMDVRRMFSRGEVFDVPLAFSYNESGSNSSHTPFGRPHAY